MFWSWAWGLHTAKQFFNSTSPWSLCRHTSRVLSGWIQMFLIQKCSPEDILLRGEALWESCGNMAMRRKKGGRFLASHFGPGLVPPSSLLCLMPQVSWPWCPGLGAHSALPQSPHRLPGLGPTEALVHPLRPVNRFIRLKQTSAKEEKQNLNWRPPEMFVETDGRGSNATTSPWPLCRCRTDKTTLPSNGALPPGSLIRGVEGLCVWKYDFVSEAKGVLTLLSNALGFSVR